MARSPRSAGGRARLLDKLAEPDSELTAAELIVCLADCDEDERDEDA